MRRTIPCILIFTQHGAALARRIAEAFEGQARIIAPAKTFAAHPPAEGVELYDTTTSDQVGMLFRDGCPLIAVASVGILVRLLAPHVQRKDIDPPVVVVDEGGRFVVPVLSGHLGGANALAERIATRIGAVAVVTTATEALATLPIDRVAAEEGWQIEDLQAIKTVARCLVDGEPVVVVQECGATAWQQRLEPLPATIDIIARWEAVTPKDYRAGVLISDREIPAALLQMVAPTWAVCRPASLIVGMGAERGVPPEELNAAVENVLRAHGLSMHSVAAIATLDRKAAEDGFRTWLAQRGWPVMTYTAEQLAQVDGVPNPSELVAQAVGTPGVCEPAALLASGSDTLLVPKQKRGRVTVAVARQSAPSPSEPSPARGEGDSLSSTSSSQPSMGQGWAGERGRLSIVGIGPGALDLLTIRALDAIKRAEVIVGYERYLHLLGDRIAGKDIRGSAIGREIDRARLAIDLAQRGREVALISSGDAGIYGMGGLVFELLAEQGWIPGDPLQVEVIPGVSAAQSAASLLGAPLANDFAVLSLSDLLTPRTVIERRLEALAAADLVIALYNPQSQRRRALFQQACQILRRHRTASTPVAVVRNAHREGQTVQIGDLGDLAGMAVDMDSLVLVGNSQTRRFADLLVTPRGYRTEPATPGASQANVPKPAASHKILFVGAGPGDPELLTLRGVHALATADVVVYAGSLIPRGVLSHARPGARLHNSAALTLEDTHRLLTEAYRAGHRVVRLHSGDPSLYGAITEQMALLEAEHIPYEIVPGVSAFQAVAARLGIEYTQPGVVQTLILTRASGRTGLPPNESLAELARHGVTLCIFLSARHVAEVQEALLTGYPATTPVAVAYRATWPDEEIVTGVLGELTEIVQRQGYERTTLIVVGPSLQRHNRRSRLYDPTHWHLFRPETARGARAKPGEPSS
ncbi:MAG TPA: precorrin-4 C(11)-methyltransferase [Alphaproteobacteria bacterium]|nr:precorrin-4 C(11)-methyltransferase [Alphaproteobacteria bacterium]